MKSSFVTKALAVTLLTLSIAGPVLADDLPTFSEPEVNVFVKSYAQFTDDYLTTIKAGDSSKLQALQQKYADMQTQAGQMAGKLKVDEAPKFSTFISQCALKIVAATQGQ